MSANIPESIEDGVVVTLDYTLTVDNEIVDTSEGYDPIIFLQGAGMVVPGLEEALFGMKVGERKEFSVSPQDGYGDIDPDAIAEIPKEEFPPEIPLEPGVELLMEDEDGEEQEAYIRAVGKNTVQLDFNHPLAGKELHFAVEVLALRAATEEEIEHGHVHQDGEDEEE